MSTEDTHPNRDVRLETDASAGYEEECEFQDAPNANQIEDTNSNRADALAAITREDRTDEYRQKHARGVSS